MSATLVSAKKSRSISSRATPSKRSLAIAFQNFTHAAGSLERSYGQLQAEVVRLRFELERTNRDLSVSLEENARMQRYLARIVEGLPCGILVVSRDGALRMMNPEARRLLSAGPGDGLADSKANIAVAPEILRRALEQLRSRPQRGECELEVETERGPRVLGLACAVLGEGQDSSTESVFVLRDITEERRRAREGEVARRKESLAEMAALLAHEIRNPLGSLELFAGLLADAASNQPDLRRWTDHIQAGLRSLSATVNNVLQFHSQPSAQLLPVNLGRLLRESLDFLRPLARQAGLRIDLQNALGEIVIPADAHRLQQVFLNVSLNAFRAMTLGGLLSVRVRWNDRAKSSGVRVDFSDTGRGIAAEHLPKLFRPGFTTTAGNPGLGLAVCRMVVEQHRGSIEVASEIGKGSTFSLVLPYRIEGAMAAAAKSEILPGKNP